MGCSFLAPVQKVLGAAADVVAPVAAAIPGPWQLPAIAYNVANAAANGNPLGAVLAALPGVPIVSQAGGIGNAFSNSVNGLSNIANGSATLAGSYGSAYNTVASAEQITQNAAGIQQALAAANPSLDPSTFQTAAQAYAEQGFTPQQISTAAFAQQMIDANPGLTPAAANAYAASGYSVGDIQNMAQSGTNVAQINDWGSTLANQGTALSGSSGNNSLFNQLAKIPPPSSQTIGGQLQYQTGLTGSGIAALGQGAASLYGAQLTADAAKAATAETTRQFDIAQTNQAPWLAAGKSALGASLDLQGLPGGTTGNSLSQMDALKSSPGYQFRLDQGQRGLDASVASRGGMGSGKAATGAIDWNQNFASNEYGNRVNQLAGLAGTGQSAANNMASQGAGYSQAVGNSGLTAAAANQSGIQGAANAFSSYLNPGQTTIPNAGARFDPYTGQRIA